MKPLLDTWKRPLLFFSFYVFLAAALIAPISSDSFVPALADYINHLAGIIQAKMALSEGQFPLRIAPTEQSGWRYPYYQFYSPTVYLIAGLFYKWIVPHNPLAAYKMTLWLSLVIAGIYMERLSFWFVGSRPAALLASVVYLFSPYYIIVINNFADLTEMMGLALVPVVLFYSLRYYFAPHQKKLILSLALVWYLLITVHIVTFVYTALFLGLLLLLITIKNRHHWQGALSLGIAIGLGCLLSAWYLAPIAMLGNDILVSQTFAKSAHFMAFKPMLSQLVFPGAFRFKRELINNHPGIGWVFLLSFAVCFYALFKGPLISNKRANYLLPSLLALFLLAFILIWSPVNFWQSLPSLFMVGQYSWRLLSQVIWIGTLLFAWGLCWLFKDELNTRHVVIGILLIATVSAPYFPTINSSNIDLEKFIKAPYFIYNHNSYSINFNKNTHYVDAIDTILIYSLISHNTLQLGLPYIIPQQLIHFAKTPTIALTGKIGPSSKRLPTLSAWINQVKIAELPLKPGAFNWNVALNPVLPIFSRAPALELQFKTTAPITISLDKAVLTGFIPDTEKIGVQQTQSFCHQEKTVTVCHVPVGPEVKLIELPALYYPKLLHITLNGKPVDYQSIVYLDSLLTTIKPEANKMNVIKIEFKGLTWANRISGAAWIFWLALLIASLFSLRGNSKN